MNVPSTGFQQDITAVVLAGGQGRRLQGQDKGLLTVNNEALVGYVLKRLVPQVGQVFISANRNTDSYARLGYRVITDTFEAGKYAGPLAGVLAGLEACDTEYMLVTPCDCPCLPADLAVKLYRHLSNSSADIAVIHDGEHLQQLFMLMHRHVLEGLKAFLANGGRAVHEWLAMNSHVILQDVQPGAYRNINTDDELQRFAQTLCE